MRNTGLNIVRKVSRFLKDIYVNPKKTDVGDIVSLDNKNKVSRSAYVRTTKNRLLVGNRSTEEFNIQRERTTAGVGVDLGIKAGDGFGTDKVGGDLNIYGGASTGQANGGSVKIFQASRAGSSGTSLNSYTEILNTELTQNRINFTGISTLNGIGSIISTGNITLGIDSDDNSTDNYFLIGNRSTLSTMFFLKEFNLWLPQNASGDHGITLEASLFRISAGSRARNINGNEFDTDTTGTLNADGGDLTLAGGAATGSGNPGGISFGTYSGGTNLTTVGTTYVELMKLDNAGNLQIDGGLTTGSTSFVNSSGVVQVATQGTIDHDSLANFVAAEHYRWDNDISGTATINAANIPTLNQNTTGSAATLTTPRAINGVDFNGSAPITITAAGSTLSDTVTVAKGGTGATSLTNNAVLLGNGTGAVEASSHLSYSLLGGSIDALVIGDGSTTSATIITDNAAPLTVSVEANSGTNAAGGDLTLVAGTSTGNAAGGDIIFRSSPTAGGSGTSTNVPAEIAVLDNTGNLQIDGNLTPAGLVLDGNTITGINDSSEFSDSDAFIMTSAAINDRFAQINADTTGNAATATNLTASTSTAVGLGTIELGHATDTTIARSAAGKVTIESAPIQTTQMSMTHHHFFMNSSSTTADFFFPYNNLNEASSTSQYYTRTIAPYAGKIVKVIIRPVAAIGTACKLQFHKIADTTATFGTATEEVTSINLNTAQTSVSTAFSSATFDAGDVIGVSLIKSASGTSNIQAVIVWEYTV